MTEKIFVEPIDRFTKRKFPLLAVIEVYDDEDEMHDAACEYVEAKLPPPFFKYKFRGETHYAYISRDESQLPENLFPKNEIPDEYDGMIVGALYCSPPSPVLQYFRDLGFDIVSPSLW